MKIYRYSYTSHTRGAKNKGSVIGHPLGQHQVVADNPDAAIQQIALVHAPSDKRKVAGKTYLKDGLVFPDLKPGTHVVLAKPYKGSDQFEYRCGVVVESLLHDRFGVHLYKKGITADQDRYYGPTGNPITVDCTKAELVGVPAPRWFKLPVKVAQTA